MDTYHISGGNRLYGSCEVSGAKNAVLPLLAASILSGEKCRIINCPALADVYAMLGILESTGCRSAFSNGIIELDTKNAGNMFIPSSLMGGLRASVFLMGPMLAVQGKFKAGYPGGCAIGERPVDLHLYAMKSLGADVQENNGVIECHAEKLVGTRISFPFKSVGATENAMMAAVLAEGITTIENAAQEPEIIELQNFLNSMGASVSGAGSGYIIIEGVKKLHGTEYRVMADRIEAGTILAAVAACGGEAEIKGAPVSCMKSTIDVFLDCGCKVRESTEGIVITSPSRLVAAGTVSTGSYPAFPTDMQSQLTAAMATADGTTIIEEKIFKDRFGIVRHLRNMGADIDIKGDTAVIRGVPQLCGARVCAEDLRGGAALVIAALAADGDSVIENVCLIDRGYDKLELVMKKLGAKIYRIKEE